MVAQDESDQAVAAMADDQRPGIRRPQAAQYVELLDLLIGHGAQLDAVDDLWGGTPLGWAQYGAAKSAIAYLQERMKSSEGR